MTTTVAAAYSARVADALAFAAECHRQQFRKGTAVPYLAHVLGVASHVWRHGGDEDQAVAALLHDVIEDSGVEAAALQNRFGARVAAIVTAATDTVVPGQLRDASTWRERKAHHLDTIAELRRSADPHGALLVVACDKLDNLTDLVRDARAVGSAAFERFNAPADKRQNVVWYQRAVVQALGDALPGALCRELDDLLADLDACG